MALKALLVVGAMAGGLENCTNCVTRMWGCNAKCRNSEQVWETNFRYREGRCQETIPLSAGLVQVDIDIWCAYPHTANWGFWWGKSVTCRTMGRDPPPLMIAAMSCSETTDLLSQKCSWHCKHRRPVSRCIVSFDAMNKYHMQQDLEKCWVREKCKKGKIKAKATCQGKTVTEAGLFGSMNLSVAEVNSFLAQPNLDFALQDGLKRMAHLGVVSLEAVSKDGKVQVSFNSSVQEAEALMAQLTLENMTQNGLLDAINGALSSQGLMRLVEGASLVVNASLGSSKEFFEHVAMMRTYQKHLDEVSEELEEIKEDLLQNISAKDLSLLREKQRATEKRLSEILSSQQEMSESIGDAISKRGNTSLEFRSAWRRSQEAAKELAKAKANLNSTKEQLEDLKRKQFQAQREALEALRKQGSLNARLKANATRLARSVAVAEGELQDLQDQYLKVQEDHSAVKQALATAQLEIQAAREGHEVTSHQLKAAERRESTSYVVMSVALAVMAIIIFGLASALIACARSKDAAVTPLTDAGQNVVVGRPVQVESSEPVKEAGPTLLTTNSVAKGMEPGKPVTVTAYK